MQMGERTPTGWCATGSAVGLGCGAHRAHTLEEYIVIDEFLANCRVVLELARF